MNPDAATIAAGAPVEFDLGGIQPGQQTIARWRERPIFIVNSDTADSHGASEPRVIVAARRSPVSRTPAAALCQELAPIDQA